MLETDSQLVCILLKRNQAEALNKGIIVSICWELLDREWKVEVNLVFRVA